MPRFFPTFALLAAAGPLSAAAVPDLEVLFLDARMWEKPVGEVLRDRRPLGFHWLSTERKDARSTRRGLKLWGLKSPKPRKVPQRSSKETLWLLAALQQLQKYR